MIAKTYYDGKLISFYLWEYNMKIEPIHENLFWDNRNNEGGPLLLKVK